MAKIRLMSDSKSKVFIRSHCILSIVKKKCIYVCVLHNLYTRYVYTYTYGLSSKTVAFGLFNRITNRISDSLKQIRGKLFDETKNQCDGISFRLYICVCVYRYNV